MLVRYLFTIDKYAERVINEGEPEIKGHNLFDKFKMGLDAVVDAIKADNGSMSVSFGVLFSVPPGRVSQVCSYAAPYLLL